MPVVFVAHNGIGVGHLSRTLQICDTLEMLGEPAVIFHQGPTHRLGGSSYPSKKMPRLADCSCDEAMEIGREITRFAGMSEPSVVFEDTHPTQLSLGPHIRRVLIVRPTVFEYLEWVNEKFGMDYDSFLIADSPHSPTWTYGPFQTAAIQKWQKWFSIGPVFRSASPEELKIARERHNITDGDPICAFTMGGGGVRSQGDPDISAFLKVAIDTMSCLSRLDPKTRFLFIRGPLFPRDVALPFGVELIDDDPCVPALLALSRAAVIRPGFNTVWECLAGGTPFIPVLGTWYQEPMEDRLRLLYETGSAVTDLTPMWGNVDVVAMKTRRQNVIRSEWTGAADVTILARQIARKSRPALEPKDTFKRRAGTTSSTALRLTLRIDDVIRLDDNCLWLLRQILDRGLKACLGIVPYLSTLTEQDLDVIDPTLQLTVGQHGFAHLSRHRQGNRRAEFSSGSLPTEDEISQIRDGFDRLAQRFRHRFRGGYSAPYDGLSPWMGSLWSEIGGRYISSIDGLPGPHFLPYVQFATETWNWPDDIGYTPSEILHKIGGDKGRRFGTALVIHPWQLEGSGERWRITELLDLLVQVGVQPCDLQDLAL